MDDSLVAEEERKQFIKHLDSPEGKIERLNYEVKHIKRVMEEMQRTTEQNRLEIKQLASIIESLWEELHRKENRHEY